MLHQVSVEVALLPGVRVVGRDVEGDDPLEIIVAIDIPGDGARAEPPPLKQRHNALDQGGLPGPDGAEEVERPDAVVLEVVRVGVCNAVVDVVDVLLHVDVDMVHGIYCDHDLFIG
jgi:hypothetical protein